MLKKYFFMWMYCELIFFKEGGGGGGGGGGGVVRLPLAAEPKGQ